jgi:hypothetical protein
MNQGASEGPIHDSLIYLPRKPITEIGKGRVIYSPENSSDRLYLVVRGRVTHKTPERVLLAFAQLADLLGTPQPDGAMRIDSLTHTTQLRITWALPERLSRSRRRPSLG